MAFNYKLIEAVKTAGQRVRVVLPYNDKYLLETLNNPKWPDNVGKRRFIGGGIDEGETPEQAATRELMEELGVKADSSKFKFLGLDPKTLEHYLEYASHGIEPGDYKATVGSDPIISLKPGLPEGSDYIGPDLKSLTKQAGKLDFLKTLFKGKPTNIARPAATSVATQAANTNSGGVLQFVKNTFKPGPAVLKKEIGDTARVYANTPYRNTDSSIYGAAPINSNIADRIGRANDHVAPWPKTPLSLSQRLAERGFSGTYFPVGDTALSKEVLKPKRPIMRHELTHASQNNPALSNSMSGLVNRLENSGGPWRKSLGRFLGEVHANAAMSKTIPGKITRGLSFIFDPDVALAYSRSPGYGGLRYAAIHGPLSLTAPVSAAYGVHKLDIPNKLNSLLQKIDPLLTPANDNNVKDTADLTR